MPDPDAPDAPAGRGPSLPTIEPFGDAALLITIGRTVDPELAARAQTIAAEIEAIRGDHPAIGRPVPAHATVLIPFDPLALQLEAAIAILRRALDATRAFPPEAVGGTGRAIEIPVRYGGADGPDLAAVAELHGLRARDVVELHAGATYRVLFLGFAPGFGYLGGLPEGLATPRRASPRERVPAGSVGIAATQTAVYPFAMPGGWQLIGRTDVVLFDPRSAPPALFRPGAAVRFVPVADR
ncbi:MAG: 5-oxoprolinase subunit PxpB [Candidatus Limnocylindrales bacterium]